MCFIWLVDMILFNVVEAEYYSGNCLDFVGTLYREITDDRYAFNGKKFVVPLADKQKQKLFECGVPEAFVTHIKQTEELEMSDEKSKVFEDEFESMHCDFICRCEGDEWGK